MASAKQVAAQKKFATMIAKKGKATPKPPKKK
jgi:hypothetical protein